MQIRQIKPYELFKSQDTIQYHTKATSDSVNNPLLILKSEIDLLYNYVQVKFSEVPLAWDGTHQYRLYDLVGYNGNIYQALEDNISSTPPSTSWLLLSSSSSLDNIYINRSSSDYIGTYDLGNYKAMRVGTDKDSFIRTSTSGLLPSSDGISSIGSSTDKFNGVFDNIDLNTLNPITNNSTNIGSISKNFNNIYGSTINCNSVLPSTINASIGDSNNVFSRMHATTFYGTSTSAQYADLAERYYSDAVYGTGTVLGIGGVREVTLYQPGMKLAGVVSTNPAFKMNDNTNENHTLMPFIALKGKIPVKTSVNIRKGQYVLASDTVPGECYGVDTLTFDMSLKLIGTALEDYFVNTVVNTVNVKV